MRWWRRWHLWVPIALIAAMALVAIVLPIWQKRDYVIALTQITEQARVQAAASSALRQQLESMTGDYNFALGKKYAFPSTRAAARRRDEAAAGRHLAHAVRTEERAPGQGAAPRNAAARRERQRRTARLAARGIEAVRAGGAAVADDQDPARSGRGVRPRRAGEAVAAAAADAVGERGAGSRAGECGIARADCEGAAPAGRRSGVRTVGTRRRPRRRQHPARRHAGDSRGARRPDVRSAAAARAAADGCRRPAASRPHTGHARRQPAAAPSPTGNAAQRRRAGAPTPDASRGRPLHRRRPSDAPPQAVPATGRAAR